jgi:hypothetical protein
MEVLNLKDKEWLEFYVGDLFAVKRPKARSEKQYKLGEVPFIASGNVNNGVIKCCTPFSSEKLDKGNCITVSPVDGSAFYQECDFLGRGGAGSSILMLYNKKINKYSGIFLTRMLRQTCSKYSYGKMGNQESIKREKIILPIDENGEPDYKFMEEYIREREQQLIQEYISYIGNKIENGGVITPLIEKEWKEFRIGDIFKVYTGGDMIVSRLKNGNIPLISHSLEFNGVVKYIEPQPNVKLFDCSKTISLADRGNFGAKVQFQNFYIGTRVKALEFKLDFSVNEYLLLFIATVINSQADKFNYGNNCTNRTESLIIILPIDDNGNPDYEYMTKYSKYQISNLKLQYLKLKRNIE